MSGRQVLGGIAAVLFLVLIVSWGTFTGSIDTTWRDTAIPCIPGGHSALKQYVQVPLAIIVDGAYEIIPGDIGVTEGCMAEIHTHDTTGTVYIESLNPDRRLTLGDFFTVWGRRLERPGYTLTVMVNGIENPARGKLFLRSEQKIELHYKSPGYVAPEEIDFEELFKKEEKSAVPSKAVRPQLQ